MFYTSTPLKTLKDILHKSKNHFVNGFLKCFYHN